MSSEWINSLGTLNTISPLDVKTNSVQNDIKTGENINFSDYLNNAINEVNKLQTDAEKISDDFAAGKTDNIHEVMIAATKADISLQFTLQVRNKIIEAYNEIMRMQI